MYVCMNDIEISFCLLVQRFCSLMSYYRLSECRFCVELILVVLVFLVLFIILWNIDWLMVIVFLAFQILLMLLLLLIFNRG